MLTGTLPVVACCTMVSGPGDANVYQPPGGVLVHAPEATSAAAPLQQIFGAVMPMKSEATPLRLVGAPVTQMFVLFGSAHGLALAGIDLAAGVLHLAVAADVGGVDRRACCVPIEPCLFWKKRKPPT